MTSSPLPTLHRSLAEVVASAILDLFPHAKLIGSAINELGFHYDFYFSQPISKEYLPQIEERVRFLITEDLPIESVTMLRTNAIQLMAHRKQVLLVEQLEALKTKFVDLCRIGDFYDLSAGPFTPTTKALAAYKLFDISEMKGEEELEIIRITGTAASDKQTLKTFLKHLESARARDHRTLGPQKKYFTFLPSGQLVWLSKGAALLHALQAYWRKGVGHRQFPEIQRDPTASLQEIAKLVATDSLRWAEWVQISRTEEVGYTHNLMDHTHATMGLTYAFSGMKELGHELISSLQFIREMITILGFEHEWILRARTHKKTPAFPEWDAGVATLVDALKQCGIAYRVDEENLVRHGPWAEVQIRDVYQRAWSCGFVEIDFNLPKHIKVFSKPHQGQTHCPAMVVSSLFGSVERLAALLIEHFIDVDEKIGVLESLESKPRNSRP
jgi:threonyl-tRNA synthetase